MGQCEERIVRRLDRLEKGQAKLIRGQKALSAAQSRLERVVISGAETCWPWDALIRSGKRRKGMQVHRAVDIWVERGCSLRKACAIAVEEMPSGYKTAQQLYDYCKKPARRNAFVSYRKNRMM